MTLTGVTREVSPALARCELTFLTREPIDVRRAAEQHDAYCRLLEELGLRVIRLPADPELPDCCFVEDTAVVLDEVAVLASLGAPSRRGELPAVESALARHRPLERIALPALLDGGDVLRVGRRLFVGLSPRTDQAGARALQAVAGPLGYEVVTVAAKGCLHLKTAVTALDEATLLVNPAWIDLRPFASLERIEVDPSEPWAANTLAVAGRVVAHTGFPRTLARLSARGYDVRSLDVSEFLKAEAGVTCKSLVFEA